MLSVILDPRSRMATTCLMHVCVLHHNHVGVLYVVHAGTDIVLYLPKSADCRILSSFQDSIVESFCSKVHRND